MQREIADGKLDVSTDDPIPDLPDEFESVHSSSATDGGVEKKKKRKIEEVHNEIGDSGEDILSRTGSNPATTKKTRMTTEDNRTFPGGGRKGVSSGLSTVIKWHDGSAKQKSNITADDEDEKWWSTLSNR